MKNYIHSEIKIISLFTFPYFFCEIEKIFLFPHIIKVNEVQVQH